MRAILVALLFSAVLAAVHAENSTVEFDFPKIFTDVIQTTEGPVRGYIQDNVQIFRGIPFAAPPTGNNRFRSPQPAEPWTSTKDCFIPPKICPQFRATDWFYLGSEDCLYLSVYAPVNPYNTPLPVFVWIFGGGYMVGDNWEFGFYDGKNLASKRNFIFVAMNYRLGSLGFMSLDQLRQEDANNSTGNYALQDQTAALQWVQRNIAAFGGDPNRVTIAGESAGAFSTCWHLVSPASRGLFHAAILESGTCDAPQFFAPFEQTKLWSEWFVSQVGCDPASPDVLQCIRDKPAGSIVSKNYLPSSLVGVPGLPQLAPLMPWGPTIDGAFTGLLDVPLNLIKAGKWNNVPVIMGTNEDEGSIFVPSMILVVPGVSFPLVQSEVSTVLNHFFPTAVVEQVLELYPSYQYASWDKLAAVVLRDYFFVCAARRALDTMHSIGHENIWLYHYTYQGDFIDDKILGDYHSSELEFVMDNQWPPLIHTFSDNDKHMADIFGSYWSKMVYVHDPTGDGSGVPLTWPKYNVTDRSNIVLEVPARVERDLFEGKCQFWDKVSPLVGEYVRSKAKPSSV